MFLTGLSMALMSAIYSIGSVILQGSINALQGMKHTIAPLICSTMELICKAVFGFKLVPMLGYPAVCACEPVAWVICMVFILAAAYAFRNDFKDTQEAQA